MTCARCSRPLADEADACPGCGAVVEWNERTVGKGMELDKTSDRLPMLTLDPANAQPSSEFVVLEGKWALQELLGKGGMGSVYRAHDSALDRTVAIKLLSATLSADPDFISRFGREARMMARLEHANLMPVYAVGMHAGSPFIVMKFLEGHTLEAHAQGGLLPIDETISITRQLCAGLGFIHGKGIIHRDIKPANVFISPDGHVTILDLGLVRSQQQEGAGLTRNGIVVGTPGYMAPEQAVAARDLDHRADLYALGVILFELVTGKPPYKANSTLELLIAHREHPVPDASQLKADVSPAVGAVLTRALAKSKEERFQTAGELLKAFEQAAREPAPARPSARSNPVATVWSRPREPAAPPAPPRAPSSPRLSAGPAPSGKRRADTEVAAVPAVPDRPQATSLELPQISEPPTRRLPIALIGGGVVGLALVAAAVAWLARAPEAPIELPIAENLPAEPAVVPAPSGPEPSPPVAAAPLDHPAPVGRPAAPAKKPAANGTVTLAVTLRGTRSWANLAVNGQRHPDDAPTTLSLAPGSYKVQLSQPGEGAVERKITVVSGKTQLVLVELKP